jgi:hypothetical protein
MPRLILLASAFMFACALGVAVCVTYTVAEITRYDARDAVMSRER